MTPFPVPPRDGLRARINAYLAFTPKDWFTAGFSALALLISVITAYYSVVRRDDNLSVVMGDVPRIHQVDADNIEITDDETTFVFINSGARSAAITGVSIFFMQHEGQSRCAQTSSGNDAAWFETGFEPIAVKANEVMTQTVKIRRPYPSTSFTLNDRGWYRFRLSDENKLKKVANIEVCYAIYLATPSVATHVEHVSGEQYRIRDRTTMTDAIDPSRPPIQLIKSSGTIFSR